jgi:hypothetical protein
MKPPKGLRFSFGGACRFQPFFTFGDLNFWPHLPESQTFWKESENKYPEGAHVIGWKGILIPLGAILIFIQKREDGYVHSLMRPIRFRRKRNDSKDSSKSGF